MSWLDTLDDIRKKDFTKSTMAKRDEAARDVVNMASYACAVVAVSPIPFSDAIVARYIDDSIRSRVSGLRLTISFGISSIAVWALGPIVKAAGFTVLLAAMAGVAALTALTVLWLPSAAQLSDGERSAVADPNAGGAAVPG